MGELKDDSKICDPNRNNLGDDYQEFLCLVANGGDRAKVTGIRERFIRLYGKWFPPFDPHDLHTHKAYYQEVINWWNVNGKELPLEEPDERFGLHIVILRRKLRVLWLLASLGNETEATERVNQLSTHYYRSYYLDIRNHCQEVRERMYMACHWLGCNIKKLKVCDNPRCSEMTTYFVRRWNNNKYCTEACCKEASEIRQDARSRADPPKVYTRSNEARKKMAQAAERRWERRRMEQGLNRGERRKGPTSLKVILLEATSQRH